MVSQSSVVACAVIWYSYLPLNRKNVTAVIGVSSSMYVYLSANPGTPLISTGLRSSTTFAVGRLPIIWSTMPLSSVLIWGTSEGFTSRASSYTDTWTAST